MESFTLLNIVLFILNAFSAYLSYHKGNYKTSMFSIFGCGCLFNYLAHTFFNVAFIGTPH